MREEKARGRCWEGERLLCSLVWALGNDVETVCNGVGGIVLLENLARGKGGECAFNNLLGYFIPCRATGTW